MKLSPQDIDRMSNEDLDREERMHSIGGSLVPRGRTKKKPPKDAEGRPWNIGRRKHGRMPTLDDMERRL